MPFSRRTGKSQFKEYPSAATIAAGDLVQFDENGEVIVAVTAKNVLGYAVNAATSSTNVTVDVIKGADELAITAVVGTMAASDIGEEVDIASASTATLTASNGDGLIVGWNGDTTTNAGVAYITLKNLAFGASGAGLETT